MNRLTTSTAEVTRHFAQGIPRLERASRFAAQSAGEHAREQAVQFLVEQVYNTAPGEVYERTQRALDELDGLVLPLGGADFILTLESAAPYAAQIEQGNELDYFEQQQAPGEGFVPRVSLDELESLALSLADDGMGENVNLDVIFQRSGQNYQEPGPHIVPAAVAGAYRYERLMRRAWEQFTRGSR
ncbi:hypothetical protein DM785_02690 [Deinococcus actinosclerus]|nr:hypothetical protein DM785_02690 [Deinococcus actinosclerus]